ncbi:hypothetical protein VB264_00355 [Arcicella aquatica]|uniref:DUF4848 domain-containing protein n=1 Tax=Arcicella aquatica TaxID=217141 RepID=A0ABU5QHB4_9BACT|nr:hypothetical protein [Arcicella aquatica]MEA5256214.1 hypothetical protein [Arcicella aquatica]
MKTLKYNRSLRLFFGCLSLLFTIGLTSCEKQEIEANLVEKAEQVETTPKVVNGRLVFENQEQFLEFSRTLEGKTQEELNEWEKSKSFLSLRAFEKTNDGISNLSDFNFPISYKSILNTEGEYVIGKNIIWFNKGLKHLIPNLDENLLKQIKNNPSLSKINGKAQTIIVDAPTMAVNASNWQFGNAYNCYVKYFNQWGESGSERRSTYQFNIWRDPQFEDAGAVYFYDKIYVKVIYEWKGSKWRRAGEPRTISWNFGFNTILNGVYGAVFVGTPGSGTRSNAGITTSDDYDIPVAGGQVIIGKSTGMTGDSYNVGINGTFTTYTIGDQANSLHQITGVLFDNH